MKKLKAAWAMKGRAEKQLQKVGAKGLRPILKAVAHMPKAMFSTPGLKKKKK